MILRFFKAFLLILSLSIVFFLVFYTFFVGGNYNSTYYENIFYDQKSEISQLIFSGGEISSIKPSYSTGVFTQKINNIDSIYFSSKDSFSFENNEGRTNIILKEGIFIIDINDLTKKYEISSLGFDLDLFGPGRIYIDTRKSKDLIFSLDSTFNFKIKDNLNQKVINSIYLFPHNYIKYDPSKNSGLADTDLFRIKTIVSNGYFNFKLTDTENLNKLIGVENNNFFKLVYLNINLENKINKDKYDFLNSLTVFSFPGKEYIDKYFSLFINKSKKKSYYKNMIHNDLIKLLNTKGEKEKLIQNIISSLNELKTFGDKDYQEVIRIINGYYNVLAKYNSLNKSEILFNFTDLINSINNNSLSLYEKNFNYLKDIYYYYDFGENPNINNYFKLFLEEFYKNLNIYDKKAVFIEEVDRRLIESFLFYLEDYIKNNIFISFKNNIVDEIFILDKYLLINNTIYFSDNTYEVVKTGLIKNIDLLKNISHFMLYTFFDIDDNKNILLIKKDILFKENEIKDLESSVNHILNMYYDNSLILDAKKDKILSKVYENYDLKFKEYFLALLDYNNYLLEFDPEQKKLFDEINNKNAKDQKVYTQEEIKTFLSQFNYIDLSNIIIKNLDTNIFNVSNIIINNNNMSFDIYPNLLYKIEKIKINGENKIVSYYLEEEKEFWNEKYKGANPEEKDKYDFKNFFKETFFTTKEVNSSQFVENKDYVEESKFILVFKRDKLLGDSGAFKPLENFLDIRYDNITVKSLDDIYIDNAKLNISDNNKSYTSSFSSKFFLDDNASYFHQDTGSELIVLDKNGLNKLFGGNKFKIIGKLNLTTFKEDMLNVSSSFDRLNALYNTLYKYYKTNQIEIIYNFNNDNITLKLENNGKIISISMLGDNIISLKIDGKEQMSNPIRYNQISSILK